MNEKFNKFQLIVANRISDHKDAQAKRLEAERARIRAEEEAKAKASALEEERAVMHAKRRAEEAANHGVATKQEDAEKASSANAQPARYVADSGATMTLGQINAALAPVKIDGAGLTSLGFEPVGQERAAKLYRASDFGRILTALIDLLSNIETDDRKAA